MRAAFVLLGACAVTAQVSQATRDDISARMATTQNTLAACYASTLDPTNPAQGTMQVSFTTWPSGEFRDVRITSDQLKDPRVEQCVVGEVSKLQLAQPTGTTLTVVFPLHFSIAK